MTRQFSGVRPSAREVAAAKLVANNLRLYSPMDVYWVPSLKRCACRRGAKASTKPLPEGAVFVAEYTGPGFERAAFYAALRAARAALDAPMT